MTECAVVEKQSTTGCWDVARYEAESLSHYYIVDFFYDLCFNVTNR